MDVQESVRKQNEIVLRLAKHVIATTAGKTSNLVFSPALINVILSFIAARSPGATQDQILSLLQASSTDELNAVSSKIVTTVLADSTPSGGPTINAANGVWIDKSLCIEQSFKDLLETSYKAAFNQVDFRTKADEVTEEVNAWVEKQTNGLITDLLPPKTVSPWTDLIFANTLFFNGRWEKEFDPSLTVDSDFYLLDGTKERVPFMVGNFGTRLVAYEGFKVLDLPYRLGRDYMEDHRRFSMEIFLPDDKDGLPSMLETLASTRGILNASEALKGLGLTVETIFHKSCIEVDEVGSKAAAAAVTLETSCGPGEKKYDFVADHPFLFLVKEYRSGLVLFLGQVIDPSMH
ncbi:unnamed protein product [Microthlaspi erraticum]|uniref:Serpin domain-containing protein n=1 Tax=Microthlaspi erraticum TaxID=1685480 RepID=A0A6D2IMM9_9BRAS|nr:unnamed protein product [Microthlaspi erraticum]